MKKSIHLLVLFLSTIISQVQCSLAEKSLATFVPNYARLSSFPSARTSQKSIPSLDDHTNRLTWNLKAGFFDDLVNGKFFNNNEDNDENKKNNNNNKETNYTNEKNGDKDDMMDWSEKDFQKELEFRNDNASDGVEDERKFKVSSGPSTTDNKTSNNTNDIQESSVMTKSEATNDDSENSDYDGYAFRDAIYQKWGKCYDVDFQPVQSFGFKELYLNVLPFHLGSKRFRHRTELDYLCHLQAVVEILEKYDQLDYVLSQLEDTTKKPRAGTSPLVAVPFRLDLTEDELNSILA